MAGRPRKPTRLKLLQGNPGRRPLPKGEPKPTLGAEPPPWLGANVAAMAEWNRMAPVLSRLGLLTELDAEALALLCAHLADVGAQLEAGRALDPRLTAEIRALLGRFGMSPGDRAKVTSANPTEPDDPFKAWKVPHGGPTG